MAQLPDYLCYPIVFWGRVNGHQWMAQRIRSKLSIGSGDFAAEAERLTEADFGPEVQYQGNDEDADVEWQMRAQSVEGYEQMLKRTESYLWGLGIAGIYHQFERDIREVIADLMNPKPDPRKLRSAKFNELCDHLEKMGYLIRGHPGFTGLNLARLISNAIKHGDGSSFDDLVTLRPDLFPEHQEYVQYMKPGTPPDMDDLRIGIVEFDYIVSAISMIWPHMTEAISPLPDRTQAKASV